MKNAHRDITAIANYTTESNNNFGVERVLEKLVQVHS
jgi:hydroxymethylpyrimidine pyrophosphatase-like HAD family hydrolase